MRQVSGAMPHVAICKTGTCSRVCERAPYMRRFKQQGGSNEQGNSNSTTRWRHRARHFWNQRSRFVQVGLLALSYRASYGQSHVDAHRRSGRRRRRSFWNAAWKQSLRRTYVVLRVNLFGGRAARSVVGLRRAGGIGGDNCQGALRIIPALVRTITGATQGCLGSVKKGARTRRSASRIPRRPCCSDAAIITFQKADRQDSRLPLSQLFRRGPVWPPAKAMTPPSTTCAAPPQVCLARREA